MANNPLLSRRPAVDASIVQADTVRGYDAPNANEMACDLVISNGINDATLDVSDILITNRTDDQDQPMFILVPGVDLSTGDRFEVYSGDLADPNGVLTSPLGSLYISNNPPALWQNQDGAGDWKKISDDLGDESLAETLVIGNTSGPTNIIMSKTPGGPFTAAAILGESISDGTAGGDLLLSGGAATGPTGNGGGVLLVTGASSNANTGQLILGTQNASATGAASGSALIQTGNSPAGVSGDLIMGTGNSDGDTGDILFATGVSSSGTGGDLTMGAFGGPLGGGNVLIGAGSPSTLANVKGGDVLVLGGTGAGSGIGGVITLQGGNGGPGGGPGGSIFLNPGTATSPNLNGQVIAGGVFRGPNYERSNGNPNTLAVPGDEGYVFQDSRPGEGALWVNTNGSALGWRKLAFAADFVNSFTRLSYGTCTPTGINPGVNPQDNLSDFGLYEGAQVQILAGGSSTLTSDAFGPNLLFQGAAPGQGAGWQIDSASSTSFQRRQRFLAIFKFANTVDTNANRVAIGFSDLSLATHLGNDAPVGNYILVFKPLGSNTYNLLTRGPAGTLNQSLGSVANAGLNVPVYAMFDLTESGVVRVQLLDDSFSLIAEQTVTAPNLNLVPGTSAPLYPVFGVARQAGAATPLGLRLYSANIVIEADQILAGAGMNTNLTLEQVLIAGNQTGANPIIFSSPTSGLLTDPGSSGITLPILTGIPTTSGGSSGSVLVGTGAIVDPANTGQTGAIVLSTGDNTAPAGGAGAISLIAGTGPGGVGGVSIGIGSAPTSGISAGNVVITGQAVQGPGDTAGNVIIQGGSYNAGTNGVSGSVLIQSGLNSGTGITGGISLQTPGSISGQGGNINIQANVAQLDGGNVSVTSGSSNTADGGDISLTTGTSFGAGNGGDFSVTTGNGASAGPVFIEVGVSASTPGSAVSIVAGDSLTDGGGSIVLQPGTGPLGDGEVLVNGKLTVTGLIDPTGLVLVAQGALPYTPLAGEGLIYVDDTTDELFYTNSSGTVNLSAGGGGGVTTLAALTDVSLAGLTAGDNLQWNGTFWTNVAGGGGPTSSLSAVLGVGNETGTNAIVISDNLTSGIFGENSLTNAGVLRIRAGNSIGLGGQGGDVQLFGGDGAGMVDGGNVIIQGGQAGSGGAEGGDVTFRGGTGTDTGEGGVAEIRGGLGGPGGGDGGDVNISVGVSLGGGADGVINMTGDTFVTGDLSVSGKLNVAGLIDPTGLVLNAQGAAPYTPAVGEGLIWINNSGEFILNSSAGPVNINSIATGTGDLLTVLGIGNTTGGSDLELSTGDVFLFNTNVSVPGGLPAIGQGKLWMNASDQVVFSNSGGDTILGGGSSQDLSQTLANGSATGTNGIEFSSGNSGISTESAAPNTSTPGAPLAIALGSGSDEIGSGDGGGNGGNLIVTGGVGGDTDENSDTGGNGSSFLFTAGSGGAHTGTGDSGDGGLVSIFAGAAGTAISGVGGNGGAIFLSAGNGGDTNSGSNSSGSGGAVILQGSNRGSNPSGPLGKFGDINIRGVNAPANPFAAAPFDRGGNIFLAAAQNGSGSSSAFMLLTPSGVAEGSGGGFFFQSGDAIASENGGELTIRLGSGGPSGGNGGNFDLEAGSSPLGTGGRINITGGEAQGIGQNGGSVEIIGGTNGTTSGSSGAIVLRGGDARFGSGGNGGDLTLEPGLGDGAGDGGITTLGRNASEIRIRGILNSPQSSTFKRGVIFMGAGAFVDVTFGGIPMASPPSVVVTPESDSNLVVLPASNTYSVTSVTTTGFRIRRDGTGDGNIPVHWIAMA